MSDPWGDGKPERGFVYCRECDGEGVIYNNADPTSGQWVRCECVNLIESNEALLKAVRHLRVCDHHDKNTNLACEESENAIAQAESEARP